MTNVDELKTKIYEINGRFSEIGGHIAALISEIEDSGDETRYVMDQTSRWDVRDEAMGAIESARSQAMDAMQHIVRASTVLREYADSI